MKFDCNLVLSGEQGCQTRGRNILVDELRKILAKVSSFSDQEQSHETQVMYVSRIPILLLVGPIGLNLDNLEMLLSGMLLCNDIISSKRQSDFIYVE